MLNASYITIKPGPLNKVLCGQTVVYWSLSKSRAIEMAKVLQKAYTAGLIDGMHYDLIAIATKLPPQTRKHNDKSL